MRPTFSDHWYRVAGLHPRLRSHVRMDRHVYRDEVWHVLIDTVSQRQHRLNQIGYRVVARLDGRLSVQDIWDCAIEETGDDAPTQPEVIALLAQLHEAGLIHSEGTSSVDELFEHADQRRARQRGQRMNLLSMRVSLFDPTRVLDALAPYASLVLRRWAAWSWLALVVTALALLAPQVTALSAYGAHHLATPRMLLIMWLAYPLIKTVHEFAHALAVRVWGGEVHEMGISLLVLMPVPFVDVSSAGAFRERHRRVLVSLMGVLTETTLAALAALLWLSVSDGLVREIAFATMTIGGISTVLFNGNPLLRFDAYYALADAIESPGLAQRSSAYWRYLLRRYLLGVQTAQPPTVAKRERSWLIGYGLASGLYRLFVSVLIVKWLISLNLIVGLLALVWVAFSVVIKPVWKLLTYVHHDPELSGHRPRAGIWAALAVLVPAWFLFATPFPDATRAPGVVWAPERAQVRTAGEGFVTHVAVREGERVEAGAVILQLQDPELQTARARWQLRLQSLDVAHQNALFQVPSQANAVAQEIRRAQAELARLDERLDALQVRSQVAGHIALQRPRDDLPGLFLPHGTLVALVLAPEEVSVRVVVSEADVSRVQQNPGPIEVRLADAPSNALAAQLRAQTPSALRELPSAALGDRAGGSIQTDPLDPGGLRTLEPMFMLDLVVPQRTLELVGGRAWARFDHGTRPLAQQWLRRLQQLFIGQFGSAGATAQVASKGPP